MSLPEVENDMQTVSIRQLKSTPSAILQQAKQSLIMITDHDETDALLVSMDQLANIPNMQQVRLIMAINLFHKKQLSVASAARFAGKPLSEMLTLISAMKLPIVDYDEDEQQTEAALIENMAKSIRS
jgi:predicted HTH domain antitoxin